MYLSEVIILILVWDILEEDSVIVRKSFHGGTDDVEDKNFQTYDNFPHFVVICFIIIEVHGIILQPVVSKDFHSGQPDMVCRDRFRQAISGSDVGGNLAH